MNLDDPKLTAYALGELEEAERIQLEAALSDDPAAVAEIEATRVFTARLRAELQAEKMPALTEEQRAQVFASAVGERAPVPTAPKVAEEAPRPVPLNWRFWVSTSIAAGVALITALAVFRQPWKKSITLAEFSPRTAQPAAPAGSPAPVMASADRTEKDGFETEASNRRPLVALASAPERRMRAISVDQSTANEVRAKGALAVQGPQLGVPKVTVSQNSRVAVSLADNAEPAPPLAFSKLSAAPAAAARPAPAVTLTMRDAKQSTEQPAPAAAPESPDLSLHSSQISTADAPGIDGRAFASGGTSGATTGSGGASYPFPQQALDDAERLFKEGHFDLAEKSAEEVLQLDPYNVKARKLEEEIFKKKDDYAVESYNTTRAHAIWRVDQAWEAPVRNFNRSGGSDALSELPPGAPPAAGGEVGALREVESIGGSFEAPFVDVRTAPVAKVPVSAGRGDLGWIREALAAKRLPPKEAVRLEDLINAFPGGPPTPAGDDRVGATFEMASCPWQPSHWLLRLGIKGKDATPFAGKTVVTATPRAGGEAKASLAEEVEEDASTVAWNFRAEIKFNRERVSSYRLLGYDTAESRATGGLSFSRNGSSLLCGQTMTVLYELAPRDGAVEGLVAQPSVARKDLAVNVKPAKAEAPSDKLEAIRSKAVSDDSALTLVIHWSPAAGAPETTREYPVGDSAETWEKSSEDFRRSAAAASFGLLLRDSVYKGGAAWGATLDLVPESKSAEGEAANGELRELVRTAKALAK